MSEHKSPLRHKSSGKPAPYQGQPLGPRPHVAVLFRDQIGDFVVATPLLRGLRERYPDLVLDYFGGERTRELEEASRLIDARYSLYGVANALGRLPAYSEDRGASVGPYALAVNLESDDTAARACGLLAPQFVVGAWIDPATDARVPPPTDGIDRLWHDLFWNRASLLDDYPELHSPYIGELFCQLARVETDFAAAEVPTSTPPFATPSVLVSTGANRSAKLWPGRHWLELTEQLRARGQAIGLLGAPPTPESAYHADDVDAALVERGVTDLRGRLTLPEVAGALRLARAFVTVDNGLMHLAAAVGTPTIAIFGASPRRLWAPPVSCVRVVEPSEPCSLCEENRFRNADCLLPVHQCLLSVAPARVLEQTVQLLGANAPA